jgi:hypothetical protein
MEIKRLKEFLRTAIYTPTMVKIGGEWMTKKTLITVATVSVLSGGLVAVTNAFAQTSASGQNGIPSLVQEIANKFHLNTSDVQSVFDQHKQEMQSKMESNYETYLQNLVNSGKITEEQQQMILNKHKALLSQMQSNKNNFKNMTPAERKSQMQASLQELKNWAKQNDINLQYLRPFGPGRGFGRFGWHKPKATPTPTPTQ